MLFHRTPPSSSFPVGLINNIFVVKLLPAAANQHPHSLRSFPIAFYLRLHCQRSGQGDQFHHHIHHRSIHS